MSVPKDRRRYSTQISQIRRLSPEVVCVSLEVPVDYSWVAGQHLGVSESETGPFSYYSIASEPGLPGTGRIDLAMHEPSIKWPDFVQEGQTLHLSEAAGGPPPERWHGVERLVLIGMGTGIAPLRSVVRALLAADGGTVQTLPQVELIQGARDLENCLFFDEFMQLSGRGLRYLPILSQPKAADEWVGRRGRVQLGLDEIRVEGAQFYLCGSGAMVSDLAALLQTRGASLEQIFSEGYS